MLVVRAFFTSLLFVGVVSSLAFLTFLLVDYGRTSFVEGTSPGGTSVVAGIGGTSLSFLLSGLGGILSLAVIITSADLGSALSFGCSDPLGSEGTCCWVERTLYCTKVTICSISWSAFNICSCWEWAVFSFLGLHGWLVDSQHSFGKLTHRWLFRRLLAWRPQSGGSPWPQSAPLQLQ